MKKWIVVMLGTALWGMPALGHATLIEGERECPWKSNGEESVIVRFHDGILIEAAFSNMGHSFKSEFAKAQKLDPQMDPEADHYRVTIQGENRIETHLLWIRRDFLEGIEGREEYAVDITDDSYEGGGRDYYCSPAR